MFNLKLAIALAAVAGTLAIAGGAWYQGYNYGKLSQQQACAESMQQYQKQVQDKITIIESNLSVLAELGIRREEQLQQDIAQILVGVKRKPVTVVKNGECIPSQTFVDGINKAISRANQK